VRQNKKTKYIKKIKKLVMDKSGILKISGVTHAVMPFLPQCKAFLNALQISGKNRARKK